MKNMNLRGSRPVAALAALTLAFSLCSNIALASESEVPLQGSPVCYPTAVTRSEDGKEIRKMYDLSPADDPAGIPRSDFTQSGFTYTMVELLKQELPVNESRQHVETVTVTSKSKDMATVLSLLPQEREFITEDGLTGVLSLALDTVKVDVAGYGSATKALSVTRTYPGLGNQDTDPIPKTVEDDGNSLILETINWQQDGDVGADGSERYTAVATYTGSATSSYVKGYTVTADYIGTVSRVNLDKTRYVAIFEGKAIQPVAEEVDQAPDAGTSQTAIQARLPMMAGAAILALIGIAAVLVIKRRRG